MKMKYCSMCQSLLEYNYFGKNKAICHFVLFKSNCMEKNYKIFKN